MIMAWLVAMVANTVGLALNVDGASRGRESCLAWCAVNAILMILLLLHAPIGY